MNTGNPLESNFRLPVVRHFIACERIEKATEYYSLINLLPVIRGLPGATFPRIHPVLYLFAQITGGRGSHSFQIERVFADDESTHTSKAVMLDLGSDPLVVHGLPFRLKNVRFQRPGLYVFRLLCDGQVIATEQMVVGEQP